MATSIEAICNLALQRVGVTQTIDRIDQRVKEAMVCKTSYDVVREKALKDAPFPFSRKYSLLARSGTDPIKWKYRYVYPNDCLALRYIFPTLDNAYEVETIRKYARETKHAYEIAIDETGEKTILTDVEDAAVEYTVDVDNPKFFDASFVSFFAWGIAGEIALPLSRDVSFAQNAFSMYEKEMSMAIAAALNEETQEDQPESEFVLARL
jgi:hypothetical protein